MADGLPAGSTTYMGETGMQAQFRDGATGKVMGECADSEIGRKYATSVVKGVTNATSTWVGGYMDSWTRLPAGTTRKMPSTNGHAVRGALQQAARNVGQSDFIRHA